MPRTQTPLGLSYPGLLSADIANSQGLGDLASQYRSRYDRYKEEP